MAMEDMDDEQLFRLEHGWSLRLKSDQETRVTPPGPNEARRETLCVTDVFLVHPDQSAAGQGVVAAWVETGARNEMLAVLSSEKPHEKLKTPVVLDEEFCFYMMRAGGDADADAVLVQFQGYALPSANTNEEEDEEEDGEDHEEDDEGATGSDYEYDSRDDGEACGLPLGTVLEDWPSPSDNEEELSDGEVNRKPATKCGSVRARRRSFVAQDDQGRFFGGPAPPPFGFGTEHARQAAAPETALLRNFLFVYLLAMVALFVYFRFFGGAG